MTETPTNGYGKEKVNGFVVEIEHELRRLDTLKGEYMESCKSVRADIKAAYDEAKESGLPKKELREVIKTRKLKRDLEGIREDLEPDEQDRYDLLRLALGDLDDDTIRDAALARARKHKDSDKAVESLAE